MQSVQTLIQLCEDDRASNLQHVIMNLRSNESLLVLSNAPNQNHTLAITCFEKA
jgi:hypothetical protein